MRGMFLPGRFLDRFNRRMARGDGHGAALLARQYVAAYPNDETGWQALGQAERRKHDLAAAEKAFAQACAVSPSGWNAYQLAEVLVDEGKTPEARDWLVPLLTRDDQVDRFYG